MFQQDLASPYSAKLTNKWFKKKDKSWIGLPIAQTLVLSKTYRDDDDNDVVLCHIPHFHRARMVPNC